MNTHPTAQVVIHIPHAPTHIPQEVRSGILLEDAQLDDELLRMTDRYTDELFSLSRERAVTVLFPHSRLVVDPERFTDDTKEPMAKKGMGVIYERTSGGEALRRSPTAEERQALLHSYYAPHHKRLKKALSSILRDHGSCLIIDAHSFSSKPLPHELDQTPNRPEICIGTDSFHTPDALANAAVAAWEEQGFTVEKDRPFSGTIVPLPFYGKDRRVVSVMVEVNRALYMHEETGEKNARFQETQKKVQAALEALLRGDW